MINRLNKNFHTTSKDKLTIISVYIALIIISSSPLNAQIKNPRTIQNLSFGTFYTGSSGGTVIIPSVGSRQATGSVVLFSSDPGNQGIIRVEINANQTIVITSGSIVNPTNGSGGSMTLQIDDFYPASPFTTGVKKDYDFYIGGTLTVGSPATTSAGNYSGSFEIIFNKQ